MGKTALFSRKQPGGVYTVVDEGMTTGDIYFVDSGSATGADSVGAGRNPDKPFLTLDYAVGQCTASQGDVIYLMPGHADTCSSAGDITLDVAGITVIGLGNGVDQPTVTIDTANTADILINAASITVENVHFIANFLDIAAAIDVDATDFTVRGCRFKDTSTTLNAKIWIQDGGTTTSNRITVEDCWCDCFGTANTHFINLAGTGDGHIIRNNILLGDWATMCIGGAGIVTLCSIIGNYIYNIVSTADTCINMGATATGIAADNRCCGGHATDGIVCGDLGSLENYYEDAESDLSGSLEPAVA
tara:strand:+ start:9780 stop:10688 length:909 start_codon:yes stop_codon:yes gene_type:complete